jgi:lipase ATG15
MLTANEMQDLVYGATLEWQDEEIEVPDVQDVETLATLAKMTANAYSLPDDASWYDLGHKWNVVR